MVLADESSLGFLAPPEFMADVIKNVVQISPFRQFVTVRTVTSRELQRPKRDTTLGASWIGETGLPPETKKKHSMQKYPVHKLGALAIVSQEALQDLPFFEQDIREEFAEQFALAEGQAFLKGDAVEKPQGILTHSDVEVLTSSVSGKIDFDDIFDLMTSLKEPYWPSATFYFQRLTLRTLRKIKDSNGQYIWEPSPAVGTPATIAGQPYVLMPDMDDVVGNKKPIIYGDLRRGYMIVDRLDLAIQILREKYVPETGYLATKRVGGQVQLAEAMKVLKVKP
jgi:HK97 family phage major capsid protein